MASKSITDAASGMSIGDLFSIAKGSTTSTILKIGLGGWLLGLVTGLIKGTRNVLELLFFPFTAFINIAEKSVQTFFISPMNIITGGGGVQIGAVQETARSLIEGFDLLALPVAQLVVFLVFGLTALYLAMGVTSGYLPGLLSDNVIWQAIFGGPEEEEEEG